MPSYTSIINSLLRIFPSEKSTEVFKAVQKLHPQSENLSNAQLTRLQLDDQLNGWLTRHAWEACRGWNWPFWINSRANPASAAFTPAGDSLLQNTSARDAAPIPGLADRFCGTVDRRAMVTPPHARFSVETWFRFSDEMFIPAQLLNDSEINIRATTTETIFELPTAHGHLVITISAHGDEDFQFIRLAADCRTHNGNVSCPVSIYFAIRPYTLESVVPVHDLVYNSKGFWMSDNRVIAWFPHRPDVAWASDAKHGDAAFFMASPPERTAVRCPAGMATAISGWHMPLREDESAQAEMIIPLHPSIPKGFPFIELQGWSKAQARATAANKKPFATPEPIQAITLETGSRVDSILTFGNVQLSTLVDISDARLHQQFLRRSNWLVPAVRALCYQGHSPDAARLLQLPALDIQKNGELAMAAGKWSLHGQFLTAVADYHRLSGAAPDNPVVSYGKLRHVARWIMRKRREIAHAPSKPQGLLPPAVTRSGAGIEYQLADNLWALQGLLSAAWLARYFHEHRDAEVLQKEAVKFTANISSAIHRELEYSLSQQVPARLHRAFDSATAAEILEIALMPDVLRALKAEDWLSRLVEYLYEPLPYQPLSENITLRRIDEEGVYPARRMLLCLAMMKLSDSRSSEVFSEVLNLQTPLQTWTECLNLHTSMGTGRDMIDIEATALFTILVRHMIIEDSEGRLAFSPAPQFLTSNEFHVTMQNAATIHGPVSAILSQSSEGSRIDLQAIPSDPTIEVFWTRGNETVSLGTAKQAAGHYTYNLPAFSNNPGR